MAALTPEALPLTPLLGVHLDPVPEEPCGLDPARGLNQFDTLGDMNAF